MSWQLIHGTCVDIVIAVHILIGLTLSVKTFNQEWTSKYFIMHLCPKASCLIFWESLTVFKEHSIRRMFDQCWSTMLQSCHPRRKKKKILQNWFNLISRHNITLLCVNSTGISNQRYSSYMLSYSLVRQHQCVFKRRLENNLERSIWK